MNPESTPPLADAPQRPATPLTLLSSSHRPAPPFAPPPEPLRHTGSDIDALYLHVPFCSTKCHYCDFYSVAGHLDEVDAYLDALAAECALQAGFFGRPAPRTIFIGGGTPTLLTPDELTRLMTLLHAAVDVSRLEEFTVEANPNTFTYDKARVLAQFGVNRLSCGAQSFNPAELVTLQRDHDPDSVAPAFDAARRAGIDNLSLDLIFGIPGQTLASWESSLARGLALDPSHISCYSLTYEPNTAMTARLNRGEFSPIDEETELAMFDHVHARLRDAGFVRYEISNYARRGTHGNPDRVCRHNLAYWQGENWLALGPAAGAHVAPRRLLPAHDPRTPVAWQWKNAGSLAHYLDALAPGGPPRLPITQLEALPRTEWAAGVAVFWLRLAEGLHYDRFAARTGIHPRTVIEKALARYVDLGMVECTPEHARILERGVPVSNRMLADVLAAMESA